jgi:hypothetical protein
LESVVKIPPPSLALSFLFLPESAPFSPIKEWLVA